MWFIVSRLADFDMFGSQIAIDTPNKNLQRCNHSSSDDWVAMMKVVKLSSNNNHQSTPACYATTQNV